MSKVIKKIRVKVGSTYVIAAVHESGTVAVTSRQWDRCINRLRSRGYHDRIDDPETIGIVITQN